jgi:hypothetical protein
MSIKSSEAPPIVIISLAIGQLGDLVMMMSLAARQALSQQSTLQNGTLVLSSSRLQYRCHLDIATTS